MIPNNAIRPTPISLSIRPRTPPIASPGSTTVTLFARNLSLSPPGSGFSQITVLTFILYNFILIGVCSGAFASPSMAHLTTPRTAHSRRRSRRISLHSQSRQTVSRTTSKTDFMSTIGDGEDEFDVMAGSAGSSAIGDRFDIVLARRGDNIYHFYFHCYSHLFHGFRLVHFHSIICISPFHNAPLIWYILVTLLASHDSMYIYEITFKPIIIDPSPHS